MHCLYPKRIKNPYTGEYMFVPCGKCDGCRIEKSNRMSARISNEIASHKYNIFFTLTYDNEHLPFIRLDNGTCDKIYNVCCVEYDPLTHERFTSSSVVPLDFCFDELPSYRPSKHWLSNVCGVLYKPHAQNFIRSLRDYLYNYYHERKEFTYIIVGEYGTNSGRPHYHGIIHVNDWSLADHVKKAIPSLWLFCSKDRIECKYLDGEKFGYLSSYIAGQRNNFGVLSTKFFREFQLFSKRPVYGVHPCEDEIIQGFVNGTDNKPFRKISGQDPDSSSFHALSPYFLRSYFPRFRGIDNLDDSVLSAIIRQCLPSDEGRYRFALACRRFCKKYFGDYSDQLIQVYLGVYHQVYNSLNSYLIRNLNENVFSAVSPSSVLDFFLCHYDTNQTSDLNLSDDLYKLYVSYLKQFNFKLSRYLIYEFISQSRGLLPRRYFEFVDGYIHKYKGMLLPKHTSEFINNF